MARITYLLILFILIVLLSYWTIKLIIASKNSKDTKDKNIKVKKSRSISDELLKLQNLKEEDILSEKEYEKLKNDLLK